MIDNKTIAPGKAITFNLATTETANVEAKIMVAYRGVSGTADTYSIALPIVPILTR